MRALEVTIDGLWGKVKTLEERLSCVMVADGPQKDKESKSGDLNTFSEMEIRVGTCTDNVTAAQELLDLLMKRLRV